MTPDYLTFLLRVLNFDGAAYRQRHDDLRQLSGEGLLEHFVRHGLHEGRVAAFSGSVARSQSLIGSFQLPSEDRALLERIVGRSALAVADLDGGTVAALEDLLTPTASLLPVLLIGDSHAHFLFAGPPMLDAGIMPVPFLCSGGSARGLANPRSRSGYGTRILDRLDGLGAKLIGRPIVFKFGQIDVEFVSDLKRIRDNQRRFDIEEARRFIVEAVATYGDFLVRCADVTGARLIVMGVFPPTLNDVALKLGYVNAHIAFLEGIDAVEELGAALARTEMPDLETRTGLHREFNERLATRCAGEGLDYLDEFDVMLDASGTVDPRFTRSHGGTDHHLDLSSDATITRMRAVAHSLRALAGRRVPALM